MKRRIFLLLLILASAASTFAFEVLILGGGSPAGNATRWNSSQFPIGYSIHNGGTASVSSSAVSTQFNRVIGIINKQSPLKFRNLGTTTSVVSGDRLNGVIFDKNFAFGSFAIAVQRLGGSSLTPGFFTEGDLIFNDKDFNFTVNASNINTKTYQVFTIMLHEMGHGAGLNHSLLRNAVMFFQFQKDVLTLSPDDKAGVRYIYRNATQGALPKLITPINNGVHSASSVAAASRFITFRWYKSSSAARVAGSQAATTFSVVFAGDLAFTKNVTKFSAFSKEALLIKGTKFNKLKNIQAASPTGQVFWRVEENNGSQILKSAIFRFKIN